MTVDEARRFVAQHDLVEKRAQLAELEADLATYPPPREGVPPPFDQSAERRCQEQCVALVRGQVRDLEKIAGSA